MAKNTPQPPAAATNQEVKPIDALNFLYTAVRSLQVNAETHEKLRESAVLVAAALKKLDDFAAAPAAKE